MKAQQRAARAEASERELTEKELIEKTGHDRSFFKKARKSGLKHFKYGRATRYLWSDWLEFREQHRKAG